MMHLRSRVTMTLAVTLLATACYSVSAVGASARFNACGLLSARQLSTVHVKSGGRCSQKSAPFKVYATTTTAAWGRLGAGSGYLLAAVYSVKPPYVAAARQLLDKGGTSVGVGAWSSFEGLANGKTSGSITFGVGNYVVNLSFGTATGHPLTSSKPFIALAKRIAAKLS
jgi:hypothetical protein